MFIHAILYFFICVISISIAIGIGVAAGSYISKVRNDANKQSLGSVVSATLALLGFILALTLSMVSSRFAIRKGLILEEANAIGTAILRTDFLEDPLRSESKDLLIRYVDVRAQISDLIRDNEFRGLSGEENQEGILQESNSILEQLWSLARNNSGAYQEPELFALYINSLNEVIDLNTSRWNQGLQYRLSRGVWLMLYLVTCLSMVILGYEFGINNSASLVGIVLLSITLSSVLLIISDLNSGGRSAITKISQQPILDLQEQLRDLRDLSE